MKKIKVLWFTNTSSNYNLNDDVYNGGGWISSLENELKSELHLKLGISFLGQGEPFKSEKDGVTYYPLSLNRRLISRIKRVNNTQEQERSHITEMLKVVADFKPDVIHIFGSEKIFGLLSYVTNIPIIIIKVYFKPIRFLV